MIHIQYREDTCWRSPISEAGSRDVNIHVSSVGIVNASIPWMTDSVRTLVRSVSPRFSRTPVQMPVKMNITTKESMNTPHRDDVGRITCPDFIIESWSLS